jgi:hypothetical protein
LPTTRLDDTVHKYTQDRLKYDSITAIEPVECWGCGHRDKPLFDVAWNGAEGEAINIGSQHGIYCEGCLFENWKMTTP